MIHIIIIILYSLVSIAGCIAYFQQHKQQSLRIRKKFTMLCFFMVHVLLCLTGITLFWVNIPTSLVIVLLILAWLSRIGNGIFVFERVHALHHVITACLFGAVFLGYYYGV